jgi:glutaminase
MFWNLQQSFTQRLPSETVLANRKISLPYSRLIRAGALFIPSILEGSQAKKFHEDVNIIVSAFCRF